MTVTQESLDELWDFSDAAASEARLRQAAGAATAEDDRAELLTQVARAAGLQARCAEADAVLDGIRSDAAAVAARVELERGRLRNSAGDPQAAIPLFRRAAETAASAGLTFLHIDALHMLAIADAGSAHEWTTQALAVLAHTDDPRTLRWAVSLHNNEGWRHFDHADYPAALASFEQAQAAAQRWGTPQQRQWADEALTETRAALNLPAT